MLRNLCNHGEISGRVGRAVGCLLLATAMLTTGCKQGYRWDNSGNVAKAEERAREQGKTLFVFYQYWLDPASNRMKGYELLSDPEIEGEFRDTVNVLIDRDFGSMYVGYLRKFNVSSYPAFVLVSPDGKYKPLTGVVSREQFLQWVRDFKARTGHETKPAGK